MSPMLMNVSFTIGLFFGLVILFWISILSGHYFGRVYFKQAQSKTIYITENTIFTLLGLMLAFTFTNSFERYEARKAIIAEEAAAVETISQSIYVLPPKHQIIIRHKLADMTEAIIQLHRRSSYFDSTMILEQLRNIQKELYQVVVAAGQSESLKDMIDNDILPTLVTLSNLEANRFFTTRLHAHGSIFILLIGMAVLSFFFIGYKDHDMTQKKLFHSVFIWSTIVVIAAVIYLNIDLEFPRIGMVRLNAADYLLEQEKAMLLSTQS